MKKGDIVWARTEDEDCKWHICIGQIVKIEKDPMGYGIAILDSKEPAVNPDGEYGLNYDNGIRWYTKRQLTLIERG